jgi:hypothetical protein
VNTVVKPFVVFITSIVLSSGLLFSLVGISVSSVEHESDSEQ